MTYPTERIGQPYWYKHVCECGDFRYQHEGPDHDGKCLICGPGAASSVPDEIRCKKYVRDKNSYRRTEFPKVTK